MQSKTLSSKGRLFNPTLFRKNLSRFWPLWGMAAFLGSLAPLALALQIVRDKPAIDPLEMTRVYYSVATGAVPVVSLLYAVLCAMLVWSYLYSARSAGMMHTLPIRREGLFFTNFLSGMAMMLLPYAFAGGLCILISVVTGCFDPVGVLNTILCVAGISLFYFATATAVAFVTGNLYTLPALYFLLHFLAVLADWLLSTLAAGFVYGLTGSPSGVVNFLSPTVFLIDSLGVRTTDHLASKPGQNGASLVLDGVFLENFWVVGAYVLAGVALLVLAYFLYRRRQSERAGDVVAVNWMRPVFRYGVAALSALLGGRALYYLFWVQFQDGVQYAALPMTVCMAVAGVIGYYAASMLLAKSLRVFHRSWPGPAAVTAAAALVCFGMQADILHMADRVPTISQVKTVEFFAAGNSYIFYPGEDDELLEQVREVHAAIAADRVYIREKNEESRHTASDLGATAFYNSVHLTYQIIGGGTVERWYSLPISRDRLSQAGTYDRMLDDLINSPGMRLKRLHRDDPRYVPDSSWISTRDSGYDLNSRETAGLLDAVERDAQTGAWGTYNWFGDERDAYAVDISVEFRGNDELKGGRTYDSIGIVLRPEMTETVTYLMDLGVLTEADLITNEEMYPYNYDENWDGEYAFAQEVSMNQAVTA